MVNFLEYFIGTVRASKSCRFQICICCLDRKSNTGDIIETPPIADIQDVSNSINDSRMVNFWSISMLLVLLEPVNRADFKYVFAVWIGSQIREI